MFKLTCTNCGSTHFDINYKDDIEVLCSDCQTKSNVRVELSKPLSGYLMNGATFNPR